jgi:hypothetical protein
MKKEIGRKLLEPDEKRTKQVKIMLTEKEYESFREKAFKSHQSVAFVVRELAKGKEVKEAMSSEKAGLLREMSRVGNNINQIAKMCRKEGVLEYAVQIEAMMKHLESKIYE